MLRSIGIGAFLLWSASSASSQSAVELELLKQLGYVGGGAVIVHGTQPAAAEGAADAADPIAAARLQKLQALLFDRRPSAVLKAWSIEEPKPPEKPQELLDAEAELAAAAAALAAHAQQTAPAAAETTPPPATEPADPAAGGATEASPSAPAPSAAEVPAEPPAADEPAVIEEAPVADDAAAAAAETAAAAMAAAEKAAADQAVAEKAAADQAAADAGKAIKARHDAAVAAHGTQQKAHEQTLLEHEMLSFQRHVTLGRYEAVKAYLKSLKEAEAKAAYQQLLTSLKNGPPPPQSPLAQYAEKNRFAADDVVGLADAAPCALEDAHLTLLGQILRQCTNDGNVLAHVLERVEARLGAEGFPLERRHVARMLFAADLPNETAAFLPTLEQALEGDDREALNLLSRYFLAADEEEATSAHLESAWRAIQGVLAAGEVDEIQKDEALTRAVALAPRVRDEFGDAWLAESFTARPERGREILSAIGAATAGGFLTKAQDPDARLRDLQLQTTAANALVAAAPERAREWHAPLHLLATNWLKEAEFSYRNDQSTSRSPRGQRDQFGNWFYFDFERQFRGNQNMPQAIATAKILDHRPRAAWLELVDAGLRPRFEAIMAQLLLKVNAEAEAFPYIERLAATYPEHAHDLVEEFLRVWTRNHNPNQANNNRNYVYIFGFEERANAIPLTRSKQERNLAELAEWVARLRALPIEPPDENLLAEAFVTAHSVAEVYRVENIERVFGSLDQLAPRTLAELIQRMRANLVGVWRDPNVQKDANTKRRQKDIQAEIQRGYEVAQTVLARAMERHADDWSLHLARAAVMHDENNYQREIEKSADFSARREEAFGVFARAAELYASALPSIKEDDQSTTAHETWFYAALGACDIGAIDQDKRAAEAQFPRIRDALAALPDAARERHRGVFASQLFTRMGSVNPAVKFRYVRAGLDIIGEHEAAREAQDVFTYYQDLVSEIRLEAALDGSPRVGAGEPFGMLVSIHHTKEIERESGGFAKYLTNQNNNQWFSWNYGRPTEDYRDKFDEAARAALAEHFEVLSITFNHPQTNSRATAEYGWRVTPYCYVLLKPRGPQVDRIPSLRLDLDFLDTSGYAVLPIESQPVAIDCSGAAEPRPFTDVAITQTLDERQARDGKLLLEMKAIAHGLVPALPTLADVGSAGFDVASIEDQGVSVVEFDREADAAVIRSERTWVIAFQGREDQEALPATFDFARAQVPTRELTYQRYVDADLETVGSSIPLVARYGREHDTGASSWLRAALFTLLVLGVGAVLLRRRGPAATSDARFRMPEQVTAFTVIGLLRDIDARNGLSEPTRSELKSHIAHIERFYFGGTGGPAPDLGQIASTWIQRAR